MTNGKTDKPRPFSVPKEKYDEAWERTFGDPREAMRQKHLQEAKAVIDAQPRPHAEPD